MSDGFSGHLVVSSESIKYADWISISSGLAAPSQQRIAEHGLLQRTTAMRRNRDLRHKSKAIGNLLQDAWFAAVAMESGCEWITTDRDYARFAGLAWRAPF